MDPHQLQNFQNSMLGSHGQQPQMQQPQYNQMLLQQQQQQYNNNFPMLNPFYGNTQMQMDPFQQQYLMMPNNQMSMFQQQQNPQQVHRQDQQHQQAIHHQLLQQQQQQRALQQQPQQPQQTHSSQQHYMAQQQQQMQMQQQQQHQQHQQQQQQQQPQQMSHQEQLFREQQRQIEQQRLHHQALLEEQRMREQQLQRQKEAQERAERAESQRREQERIMREQEEQRKKMEEVMKLADEQRRKEEKERIEKENLMRIRQEQIMRQRENESVTREMMERLGRIGQPLTLITTHYVSDLRSLIPMPSECMEGSILPLVSEHVTIAATLDRLDQTAVETIANILSQVDVSDIKTRQDNVEQENNDLPLSTMPEIIRNIVEINSEAFDVEPEHNDEVLNTMFDIHELTSDDPPRVLVQEHEKAKAAKAAALQMAHEAQPSTSETSRFHVQIDQQEAAKLRKQMISMGKGPKGNQRKKRDMVESLYDSLTDYFDPSDGQRRRRGRTRTTEGEDEEEQLKRDLELIAQMEAAEKHERKEQESSDLSDDDGKTPNKRKRPRKEEDRPPTPTEVIQQRDIEWNERQRKKLDKRKRRKIDEENDYWNNEMLAESDSFTKFSSIVDGILDQVEDLDVRMANGKSHDDDEEEDEDVDTEFLIERGTLEELKNEAQKLKSWRKLNKIPVERLTRLMYILERNMRDVVSQDGSRLRVPFIIDEDGEEEDLPLKEFVTDRLFRACDAASVALTIMTSNKMPKQVYIEDTIDRAISLCKHYLNQIIFPASDSIFRASTSKRKPVEDGRRKKKAGTNNRSRTVEDLYSRVSILVRTFGQLVRMQPLPETSIHHLASLAVSTFFVNNVGALQYGALSLASNIFSISGEEVRTTMLTDMLNSLHRLPPGKNLNNSYRFGNDLWISNTTLLFMQLIQSIIKMPKLKKSEEDDKEGLRPDTIVIDSFKAAHKLAGKFLHGFLTKCSVKGSKTDGEDDYRRIFEGFLQDLLVALYKPEWPSAEMILSLLGPILVHYYRNKTTDMIVRQACLDYLGTITARLRKDVKSAAENSEERLSLVVKTLIYEEQEEQIYESVSDVNIDNMSYTDRLKKLEQALIDYLIERKDDENLSVEYTVKFYAGEWYRETFEDLEDVKKQIKELRKSQKEMSDKEIRKLERRQEKMMEKGEKMKEFLITIVDKKHMRKRSQLISNTGNVMLESDAAWAVKFLASRREFSHSFDSYLRHILYGVTAETTVGLRTRAMKCLTQIIEADYEVLGMADVQQAVNSRMMDPNAAVREATIELLGKFLLVKEEFIPKYYNVLLERIKDSGTAVRKRVIRIMREICEKYPNFESIPDMLSKLVRRIIDEDGVKKLVIDTFSGLWFQPCSERAYDILIKKVLQMTNVAQMCAAEQTTDFLEQLLQQLLKLGDRAMLVASKQIVDSLVDNILILERNMAADTNIMNEQANGEDLADAKLQKNNQDRLLACLTTLSIFSKVRPELMVQHAETLQPYLSMTVSTVSEQQVLNEVINMLERIVPLMSHPSESFLISLDESLAALSSSGGMKIIESAIRGSSAVWTKFPRNGTAMTPRFLSALRLLNSCKQQMEQPGFQMPPNRAPIILRSVYTIGLLARYFNFDLILQGDIESEKSLIPFNPPAMSELVAGGEIIKLTDEDYPEGRKYRDNVFLLLLFFSRFPSTSEKAVHSIGHLCAQYADYLATVDVRSMYLVVLRDPPPARDDAERRRNEELKNRNQPMRIQVLKNLEMFLSNEEKKAIKSNQDWEKLKDQQNLKDMELSGSGLSSAVIQIYWNDVLECYVSDRELVRNAVVQVVCQTLNQGLVTPGNAIAVLIAMTTDPIPTIRIKVENLLKEIDQKYSGMVQSRAIKGVRYAFVLNRRLKFGANVVRGIRACDASVMTQSRGQDRSGLPKMTNDGQAVLSGLYTSLRGNRNQRRSFLQSVLRLFSEDSREKVELDEWIFIADNIAMFPYQVLDEPLYAIHQIDGIVSLSGQSIINQFKEHLIISPHRPIEDDDTLFEAECLFQRFPDNKKPLFDLMLNSQACFILLYLKNFLMKLYGFTEAKVKEYSPSEAAKVYEKAVTRKNVQLFNPASALQELQPEVIAERDSLQGQYNLAHKICYFRKMLLSLDKVDEDDVDECEQTTGIPGQEDEDDIDGEFNDLPEEASFSNHVA